MATRIRYVKSEKSDVLVSKQVFFHPTDASQFQVQLNEADKTFKVINLLTGTVLEEGKAVNNHQARVKAKNALVNLGIQFEGEKRDIKIEETQEAVGA